MDDLNFDVEIRSLGGLDYEVIARSPTGEGRTTMRFPFDEIALQLQMQSLQIALLRSGGTQRRLDSPEEGAVKAFGQKLFDALVSGEVRSRFDSSLIEAEQREEPLRFKLRFDSPTLAGLPWEFLFDSRLGEYLVLATSTPLVRYIELPEVMKPLTVTPPLRMLGVVASPAGLAELDVAREKIRIEQSIKDIKHLIELHWLEHPTADALQQALWREKWHIFHFAGHGGFDSSADEGVIALEDEDGNSSLMSARKLGMLLGGHQPLRLAVLNACEGARGSEHDLFSSTAATLVRRKTPAVVAMQFEISDRAAIQFGRVFYRAIADGLPVDRAVTEARKNVSLTVANSLEWGTPVLFMRSRDGVLFRVRKPKAKPEPSTGAATATEPSEAPNPALPPPTDEESAADAHPATVQQPTPAEGPGAPPSQTSPDDDQPTDEAPGSDDETAADRPMPSTGPAGSPAGPPAVPPSADDRPEGGHGSPLPNAKDRDGDAGEPPGGRVGSGDSGDGRGGRRAPSKTVLGAAGAAVAVVLAAALIGRAMGGSGASPSASPFPSTSQIAVQSDVPSESPSNGPPPSGSQPPPKPLKIAIVVKDNAANSKGIIASVRQAIADAGGSVRSLKVSAPSSAILFEATPGFDLTPILDDPDIVAVVGPYTSPVAATHIPETSEQGLAMCSPSATQDSLTVQNLRAGRPVSFVRTVMTNGHQGAATARFVFDDLGLRRVFIVGKGSGTGRASQFEEYWKSNNGDVVDNQSMDAKAVDYTGLALSIKATAPDVVYFSGNGGDDTSAGAFYKQLRSSGVGVPFVTSGEAFTDKFQRDVSGFADSQLYTTYPTAAYYANRPGFTDKLGIDPGIYALTAYSCARAILDGMARTDLSLDRGSLRDEIRANVVDPNLTHHSPMGDFSFDPNGDTRLQILTAYQFDTDSSAWIAIGETAAP